MQTLFARSALLVVVPFSLLSLSACGNLTPPDQANDLSAPTQGEQATLAPAYALRIWNKQTGVDGHNKPKTMTTVFSGMMNTLGNRTGQRFDHEFTPCDVTFPTVSVDESALTAVGGQGEAAQSAAQTSPSDVKGAGVITQLAAAQTLQTWGKFKLSSRLLSDGAGGYALHFGNAGSAAVSRLDLSWGAEGDDLDENGKPGVTLALSNVPMLRTLDIHLRFDFGVSLPVRFQGTALVTSPATDVVFTVKQTLLAHSSWLGGIVGNEVRKGFIQNPSYATTVRMVPLSVTSCSEARSRLSRLNSADTADEAYAEATPIVLAQ